jgi:hypothetical protein
MARTNASLRRPPGAPNLHVMKKRVLAGLLWFYATWYAWNVLAAFLGLPELAGPVVAAAVAMLLAGDPFGRIWSGTRTRPVAAATQRPAADPV